MHFALLLSDLPRVEQSRVHYDAMLSLDTRKPFAVSAFWHRLKPLLMSLAASRVSSHVS
jgi:hypothetical protein